MNDKVQKKVIPFKRRTPTEKYDFSIENHGSVVFLKPLTQAGIDWANDNIGKDNGYQPCWPTILLEPRYVDNVVAGIRNAGLVAR